MLTILSQKAYMVAKATFMVKTQAAWWRQIPQCNECLQIWHRRQQAKVQAGKEAGGLGRPPPVASVAMLSLSYQRMILRTALLSFCHWCKSAKASCLFHGTFACCILVLDLKAFMHLFVSSCTRSFEPWPWTWPGLLPHQQDLFQNRCHVVSRGRLMVQAGAVWTRRFWTKKRGSHALMVRRG